MSNVKDVIADVREGIVVFKAHIQKSETPQGRGEAWAQQQQSLLGYKVKKHGFQNFREVTDPIYGSDLFINYEWTCSRFEQPKNFKNIKAAEKRLGDKLESKEEVVVSSLEG